VSVTQYRFRAEDESDTGRLAEQLADRAFPGAVLALDGDLGAGKTRFTQCFAARIGVKEMVNSPTFTLIREYESGRLPLYHMDVYRIDADEAGELGLDEYFFGEGVTIVEWAERILELLPEERLHIEIRTEGETGRLFTLQPYGHRHTRWCDALKESGVLT
jgi:tRNA threonylcarbamoyladenosine biosynthesis protein TsaE